MKRRSYEIDIVINAKPISRVIIDPHYELKHSASMSDELILELVRKLDGARTEPEKRLGSYAYFESRIELRAKSYKLIWLLEENEIYIGIINAYRRR
ncbi:MAG: hypothetical protein EOP06_29160 [Proteobacteria bacterium]|nr:MAG: hypothetical protein EOP06_29160 [Pseudomonadota bacterium]